MLPGITPIVGNGVFNPSFKVGGSATDAAGKTTYTFTGVAAPSPKPGRYVLVAVSARSSSSSSATSATINGGATLRIGTYSFSINSGYNVLAFFIAEVGSGETVNVSVTFSAAQARCGITVFSLFNFENFTTPTETKTTNGAGSASGSINVNAKGAVFGVTYTGVTTGSRQAISTAADTFAVGGSVSFSYSAASDVTWTGLTKTSDETLAGGTSALNSGLFVALR